MRSGYNPTRRNRNIGSSARGHGSNNRLTIPRVCQEHRTWWEQIDEYEFKEANVHGRHLAFVVERLHPGFVHACTIKDVLTILEALPSDDLEGMNTFVLRQPTRKQRIIAPAWGRMAYSAAIGRPGKRESRSGPAIFIEAQSPAEVIKWSRSLDPDDCEEVSRLVNDGHQLEDTGKVLKFHSTPESIRNTQLYRTLIHEVGHWADWLQFVVRPSGGDPEKEERLSETFFSRPQSEREAFAHRYATSNATLLLRRGIIPFSGA